MQLKFLQMKRALRVVLLVLLINVVGMGEMYAQGQNVTIGDLKYWLFGSTARVIGHIDGESATGSLVIPSSVSYGGSVYSVTEIDWFAFNGCSGFTGSLTIPNSVATIGSGAFTGCTGLTSVIIGNSVTSIGWSAFSDCTGLTSVIIGDSVTEIGAGAFKNCSGMTSITIPSSVTLIGDNNAATINPFYGCTNLTSIIVEVGNTCFTSIDGVVFNLAKDEIIMCPPGKSGAYVIPNSVTSIGNQAFEGCTCLTSVSIPNSVISIGGSAFSECTGLTSVTIPVSVTTIAGFAFYGCTNLTNILVAAGSTNYASIDGVLCNSSKDKIILYPPGREGSYVIPNSITIIGAAAFYCHAGLVSVTIPTSVTTIERLAFIGCTGLVSITIPNSVNTLEEGGKLCFSGCTSLVSVTIGNSVTSIGGSMFLGCTSLTSVIIGNSVADIGNLAFGNCTSLREVNFDAQNGPLTIGEEAFSGCTSLTSVIIPDFVTAIGNNAFEKCTSLNSVTIGNSVTSVRYGAFEGCVSLKEINFNAKDCVNSDWTGCTGVTTIAIGDSVEVVRENMFSGFENLTTLTIGKSVNSIGSMAFSNNPRLNMVYYNVEKELESANNVFDNCPNLTTIHIGADVQEIGSNIFKGCNTVHFVVALGPTPAVLDAGAFSDIVDNSVLMVSCGKRVTYYSVWNMFPFNNIIEDCNEYLISIGVNGTGGNVTSSVTNAQMGQTIVITITPNPGMMLSFISVVNANDPTQIIPITPMGKSASNYSFVMPPFEVVVMATFTTANTSVEENITASIPASVYPNPTTGFVKVEAENLKQITISNVLGQQIYNGKAAGNEFEYDFGKHGAGLYLIRIETANGMVVKKVSVR